MARKTSGSPLSGPASPAPSRKGRGPAPDSAADGTAKVADAAAPGRAKAASASTPRAGRPRAGAAEATSAGGAKTKGGSSKDAPARASALEQPASEGVTEGRRSPKAAKAKPPASKKASITKAAASPGKATGRKPSGKAAADPAPAPRRRAVANAAAATHGRSVTPWTAEEITEAFARLEAINPEPLGELEYVNPFTLLVAVVLSAQATDAGVNKATRGLFAAASTPQAMAALGEEGIAGYIRTIGLYKGKANNVAALSRLLLERYGGEVPRDREALESLPGVGRKTANVVLNIAFQQPTIAVDTHLFRVANRTGLAPGKTPLAVEEALEARIPEHFKLHAHHWLILHGRYICKARLPDCFRCPIQDLCRWPEKNL